MHLLFLFSIYCIRYFQLEDDLNNLDDKLQKARANANALNVVNEMLLKDNKERDETIAQYKKKLESSSDRDSMLDGNSPVQVTARETNRGETQERRIGSKALHALTALGADNTMGIIYNFYSIDNLKMFLSLQDRGFAFPVAQRDVPYAFLLIQNFDDI